MDQITRMTQIPLYMILGMGLATASWAQESGRQDAPSGGPVIEERDRLTERDRGGAGMEERARHFEARKRERLLQALQLDDATRERLRQRLEQLDQRAEDLRRQRREAMQALRDQAKDLRKEMRRGRRNGGGRGPEEPPPASGPADNTALRQALDRVYAAEDAMAGLRHERLQAVRDLLTPEQQVKYLLFTMKFQKEMRERLQRERR